MTRKGFLSAITFGLLGQSSSFPKLYRTLSSDEDPDRELYWEVIYRCPRGHTYTSLMSREVFNLAAEVRSKGHGICSECHDEWLTRNFPPHTYLTHKVWDRRSETRRTIK